MLMANRMSILLIVLHRLLVGHQLCVNATSSDQLLVATRLHQTSLIQHQDAIGPYDAGESVGDGQGGPALHEVVEGLLDGRLVLRVHAGQSLVQYQDGRVLQQSTCYGDALPLPSGKADGTLAHHSVVPVGQCLDKVVGVGHIGRVLDFLLSGIGLGETQVLGDSAVEQVGILPHHGHMPPQVIEREFTQVLAAQQDASLLGVEEPQGEGDDGGLACATGADQA